VTIGPTVKNVSRRRIDFPQGEQLAAVLDVPARVDVNPGFRVKT